MLDVNDIFIIIDFVLLAKIDAQKNIIQNKLDEILIYDKRITFRCSHFL